MEIGLIIVLFAIVISIGASELWDRIKWHRAYTEELERTVQRQERSLQHYRFMRLQKEMEKEMTAGNELRRENNGQYDSLQTNDCIRALPL